METALQSFASAGIAGSVAVLFYFRNRELEKKNETLQAKCLELQDARLSDAKENLLAYQQISQKHTDAIDQMKQSVLEKFNDINRGKK